MIYVLGNNIKNIKVFLMNFSVFTAEKNLSILHGHIFIMTSETSTDMHVFSGFQATYFHDSGVI